ncbi:Maf family protein [Paenibacillus sp. CAU 1782]
MLQNPICISRLVLASSSPRRRELVASLDLSLPVSVLSPDVDESVLPGWTPNETVRQLSASKAQAAMELLKRQSAEEGTSFSTMDAVIIAADTVVALDGEVLGKPLDENDAVSMLMKLQGSRHEVYTGIAVLHTGSGEMQVESKKTIVKMKAFTEEKARRYAATGEPLDKAGAYGIQGLGATLVEEIEGCYFNVVGLPLSLLADMLEPYGIQAI